MSDDFLIRVRVDQKGVEAYARELGKLPGRLKRLEAEINRMAGSVGGARVSANADPLTRAVQRQARLAQEGQRKVGRAMARISIDTQQDVARRLQQGLVRPDASTGALRAFTLSRRNRKAGESFFGVGDVEAMLSNRKVKYALAIEGGSDAAVRRKQVLFGLWGMDGGRQGFLREGMHLERFYKMSAHAAATALAELGTPGSVIGTVRKPIRPHRNYRKTVQYFKPQAKTAQAIREAYGFR